MLSCGCLLESPASVAAPLGVAVAAAVAFGAVTVAAAAERAALEFAAPAAGSVSAGVATSSWCMAVAAAFAGGGSQCCLMLAWPRTADYSTAPLLAAVSAAAGSCLVVCSIAFLEGCAIHMHQLEG